MRKCWEAEEYINHFYTLKLGTRHFHAISTCHIYCSTIAHRIVYSIITTYRPRRLKFQQKRSTAFSTLLPIEYSSCYSDVCSRSRLVAGALCHGHLLVTKHVIPVVGLVQVIKSGLHRFDLVQKFLQFLLLLLLSILGLSNHLSLLQILSHVQNFLQFLSLLLPFMLQLSNHLPLLQVPFHKREYTIHVPALYLKM